MGKISTVSQKTRSDEMGKSQSKSDHDNRDRLSPLENNDWQIWARVLFIYGIYGFPEGGSLSKRQIEMLKDNLEKKDKRRKRQWTSICGGHPSYGSDRRPPGQSYVCLQTLD